MTTCDFDARAAAALLLAARRGKQPVSTAMSAPACTQAAYTVQEAVMAGLGDPGGVWKMALLGGAARETAILPRAMLYDNGARPVLPDHAAIEVETALVLAGDPGADPGLEAIAEIRLAFEFVAARLAPPIQPHWAMADSFNSAGIVLGEQIDGWRNGLPDLLGIGLTLDGDVVRAAESAAPMADALDFLAWLSRHARDRGRPLKQGDVVITGARLGPLALNGATVAHASAMGAWVRMG